LSFVVDILAFFDLATFWALLENFGKFFFLSSGHPVPGPELKKLFGAIS
jgi:hypothetical protein